MSEMIFRFGLSNEAGDGSEEYEATFRKLVKGDPGHSPVITSERVENVTKLYCDGKLIAEIYDGSAVSKEAIEAVLTGNITSHTHDSKQDTISDLSQIRERANEGHTALQPSALNPYRTAQAQDFIDEILLGSVNAKYTKPNTGIPKSDLASGVQSSLGKADSALQDAPSDGKQYLRKDGAWSEVDSEGVVIQVAELPAAASKALGTIVQYVGETTESFTNGYFYKVVFVRQGSLFIHDWERTDVQPGTSGEISASNVIFEDEEDAETKVTELKQVIDGKADKAAIVSPASASSFAIEANKQTRCGTLAGNTTFTLAPYSGEDVAEYDWTFTTPSTAPTITFPSGITWAGGSAPTINASKTYEINIVNGLAIAVEF